MGRPLKPAPAGEKRCSRCGECWPADREFFSPDRHTHDGLAHTCKACQADHKRAARGRPIGRGPGLTDDVARPLARALWPGSIGGGV
jgi:hypothetical protein